MTRSDSFPYSNIESGCMCEEVTSHKITVCACLGWSAGLCFTVNVSTELNDNTFNNSVFLVFLLLHSFKRGIVGGGDE